MLWAVHACGTGEHRGVWDETEGVNILADQACLRDGAGSVVFDGYQALRYVTGEVDHARREQKATQAQDDRRLTAAKHLWPWKEEKPAR